MRFSFESLLNILLNISQDVIESIVSGNFQSLRCSHPTWTLLQEVKLWNINKKGLNCLSILFKAGGGIRNLHEEEDEWRSNERWREWQKWSKKRRSPSSQWKKKKVEKLEEIEEPKTLHEITFPIIMGFNQGGYKHKEKVGEPSATTSCLKWIGCVFE